MPITHVTAHFLQRAADAEAKLSLRQDELAVDENKDELLDKLKNSFLSRLARKHGSFNAEDEPSLLATELDRFLNEEHSFSEMSATLMKKLESGVNEKEVDLKSHFLFFLESMSDQHNIFYLFVVSQNESLAISDSLEVTPSYSVDTGPSMFGIKVDLAEWKVRKNYAYLSYLPPRSNTLLAEVFDELSGFGAGVDKTEATEGFLKGVEAFAKQVPEEKVNEYRAKVVDYCVEQDEKDEPINIRGLSKELEGIDCEQFVREVLPHNPAGEEELRVDRRSLRRYVKFSGRDKDLSVSFSTYHLNGRVTYNDETDTLSIHGLPNALRSQLLAHIKSE
ncbi:nucleoid-associated protein [Pseudomonadota bacterium]